MFIIIICTIEIYVYNFLFIQKIIKNGQTHLKSFVVQLISLSKQWKYSLWLFIYKCSTTVVTLLKNVCFKMRSSAWLLNPNSFDLKISTSFLNFKHLICLHKWQISFYFDSKELKIYRTTFSRVFTTFCCIMILSVILKK